ncbi:MAG: EAL domain-containing protein [Culicoidibacterales bacterium]
MAIPIQKRVVKVGFYEYMPYYYRDEDNNPQGYYHEFLEILAEKLDFKYEYVEVDPPNILKQLENGEFDLAFGAIYTKARAEKFVYSQNYLQFENHSIYIQEQAVYEDLEGLSGKTVGYLSEEIHNKVFADQIKMLEVNVELQQFQSYEELKTQFYNQELDAVLVNTQNADFTDYRSIYTFSSGPVYIVATPKNNDLINEIDQYIKVVQGRLYNPFQQLYTNFFNESQRKQEFLFVSILLLGGALISVIVFYAKRDIKRILLRFEVSKNLRLKRYCLYYQPIMNHHSGSVASAEALLRLRVGDQVVGPYQFLTKIEQAEMMYEVTMEVFRQAVQDYPKLAASASNEEFYISLNVSFAELLNPKFTVDVLNILKWTPLTPNQFCFEIIEREKLAHPEAVLAVIATLQNLGFKIALDDFGTEYSNFDVLEVIPYDILKIDKQLVDTLTTSFIKQELIRLLTKFAEVRQTRVIIEGVEDERQVDFLRQFSSDYVSIQGYYYSPPIPLEQFQQFASDARLTKE